MSSIVRRTLVCSARSLRSSTQASLCTSALLAQRPVRRPMVSCLAQQSARAFSASMIPKSDAHAAPAPPQEFDKEIVDMADYASNYKINSDLAVGRDSSIIIIHALG